MKTLAIKWTISKARDTYGYNIVTLNDGMNKHRASGGGYDMLGTVFGDWLMANYKEKIIQEVAPHGQGKEGSYGLFLGKCGYYIDGACGFDCIKDIAKKIGLKIQCVYFKGSLTNILVEGE